MQAVHFPIAQPCLPNIAKIICTPSIAISHTANGANLSQVKPL